MYDYDIITSQNGLGKFFLRGLPDDGSFCRISEIWVNESTLRWVRITQWGRSIHGRRRVVFGSEDQALASGIAWAKRRAAEDRRMLA